MRETPRGSSGFRMLVRAERSLHSGPLPRLHPRVCSSGSGSVFVVLVSIPGMKSLAGGARRSPVDIQVDDDGIRIEATLITTAAIRRRDTR